MRAAPFLMARGSPPVGRLGPGCTSSDRAAVAARNGRGAGGGRARSTETRALYWLTRFQLAMFQ